MGDTRSSLELVLRSYSCVVDTQQWGQVNQYRTPLRTAAPCLAEVAADFLADLSQQTHQTKTYTQGLGVSKNSLDNHKT
jgi:hypothetical protein